MHVYAFSGLFTQPMTFVQGSGKEGVKIAFQ